MVPLTTDNNQDTIKASKVFSLKLRSHGYLKCDLGDQLTTSTAILQLQKEEAMAKSLKEVVKFKQFQTRKSSSERNIVMTVAKEINVSLSDEQRWNVKKMQYCSTYRST